MQQVLVKKWIALKNFSTWKKNFKNFISEFLVRYFTMNLPAGY